jgi:hypothetical protein
VEQSNAADRPHSNSWWRSCAKCSCFPIRVAQNDCKVAQLSSNRRRYADSPSYLCDQFCNRTPRGFAVRIIVNRSNNSFATNALPIVVLLRPPKQPDIGAPAATRSRQTSILHNHSPCPRSRCKEIFAWQNRGVLEGALESGKSGGVLLCGGGVLDFAKCQTNLIHDNWAASPKMWHHRVPPFP